VFADESRAMRASLRMQRIAVEMVARLDLFQKDRNLARFSLARARSP
jgi:hypothetical protein